MPAIAGSAPLKQLVYTSRMTAPMDAAGLERLLVVSRHNNRSLGVTGLLIVYGDRFMQCLEGAPAAVDEIFGRIRLDPRHHAVDVRLDEPVPRRAFAAWDMACAEGYGSHWLDVSTMKCEVDLLFKTDATAGHALLQHAWTSHARAA